MVNETHRVVYKPSTQTTDEFIAIVNLDDYKKWKEGDKSIALALVVESFTIYFSNQGHQGLLGEASKQQLENTFGTSRVEDALLILLEKGTEQTGGAISTGRAGSKNDTRGSKIVDTKGKSGTGI